MSRGRGERGEGEGGGRGGRGGTGQAARGGTWASRAVAGGVRGVAACPAFQPPLSPSYVDQALGTSPRLDKELFFSHPAVIRAFVQYVKAIVTRVNTVTGVPYAADPAVLAWELANEPQARGAGGGWGWEGRRGRAAARPCQRWPVSGSAPLEGPLSAATRPPAHPRPRARPRPPSCQTRDRYEADRGMVPGSTIHAWAKTVSAAIKALDPIHLVALGDEGWRADQGGVAAPPGADALSAAWMGDGAKGVDYVANAAIPTLDFCTLHVYPANWGFLPEQ